MLCHMFPPSVRARRRHRRPIGLGAEPAIAVLGALVLVAIVARVALPDTIFPHVPWPWTFGAGPPRDAESAHVVAVIDGDTIVIDNGRHVRVIGIDTPETVHPDLDGPQPFGPEATARMSDLVEGRRVALEADATDSDHYGRELRHLWIGRRLAAEILIREGLGHVLMIPPNTGHADCRMFVVPGCATCAPPLNGVPSRASS